MNEIGCWSLIHIAKFLNVKDVISLSMCNKRNFDFLKHYIKKILSKVKWSIVFMKIENTQFKNERYDSFVIIEDIYGYKKDLNKDLNKVLNNDINEVDIDKLMLMDGIDDDRDNNRYDDRDNNRDNTEIILDYINDSENDISDYQIYSGIGGKNAFNIMFSDLSCYVEYNCEPFSTMPKIVEVKHENRVITKSYLRSDIIYLGENNNMELDLNETLDFFKNKYYSKYKKRRYF